MIFCKSFFLIVLLVSIIDDLFQYIDHRELNKGSSSDKSKQQVQLTCSLFIWIHVWTL